MNVSGSQPIIPSHTEEHSSSSSTSETGKELRVFDDRVAASSSSSSGHEPIHGEVVLLIGTSTAGKSSIISGLIQHESRFLETGVDQAGVRILLEFFEKHHPDEMQHFKEILDINEPGLILDMIVGGLPPTFNNKATPSDKEQFSQEVQKMKATYDNYFPPDSDGPWAMLENMMLDEVLLHAKSGTPVIFDALKTDSIATHVLFRDPAVKPKIVLVYCPFQDLSARVINRNKEAVASGNPGDVRAGVFPLEQFAALFKPKESDDDPVIQTISKKDAEEAVGTLFDLSVQFQKDHSPIRLEGKDLLKERETKIQAILSKLGFEQDDPPDKVSELTPRFNGYNIIINTSAPGVSREESVQRSVEQILFDK